MWGTWHIISPSEKVGGHVPSVPHQIAPMHEGIERFYIPECGTTCTLPPNSATFLKILKQRPNDQQNICGQTTSETISPQKGQVPISGLKSTGAEAGKISRIPACAGLKFVGAGPQRAIIFNPHRTRATTRQGRSLECAMHHKWDVR